MCGSFLFRVFSFFVADPPSLPSASQDPTSHQGCVDLHGNTSDLGTSNVNKGNETPAAVVERVNEPPASPGTVAIQNAKEELR